MHIDFGKICFKSCPWFPKGISWLVVNEIAKAAKKISVQFSYLQMLLHPRGTEHALLDNRLLQDGGLRNDIKI